MTPVPPARVETVSTLAGEWAFHREVLDRTSGSTGTAEGTALFEPNGEGLDWIESGTLKMNGHTFDAKRRLLVRQEEDGWVVRFDDGRLFHPLSLEYGKCEVGHPCRDDFYDGHLELNESGFRTEWNVTGPAKDQHIVTTYIRA